jgi:hypothetical protein
VVNGVCPHKHGEDGIQCRSLARFDAATLVSVFVWRKAKAVCFSSSFVFFVRDAFSPKLVEKPKYPVENLLGKKPKALQNSLHNCRENESQRRMIRRYAEGQGLARFMLPDCVNISGKNCRSTKGRKEKKNEVTIMGGHYDLSILGVRLRRALAPPRLGRDWRFEFF